jgi:hypothetical protein
MHFIILILLYDFLQVLYSARKVPTKINIFPCIFYFL